MIDIFEIRVVCIRKEHHTIERVEMRGSDTIHGPIYKTNGCDSRDIGSCVCDNCICNLVKMFMYESYRYDPKYAVNPFTKEHVPLPEKPRRRR